MSTSLPLFTFFSHPVTELKVFDDELSALAGSSGCL